MKAPSQPPLWHWPWLAGLLATGAAAQAPSPAGAAAPGPANATLAHLLARSPFLPAGNGPVAAPAEEGGLEFRGFFFSGDEVFFSIHLPARKAGVWLKPGQSEDGLTVFSHDLMAGTINVDYQGQRHTLALRLAKVADNGSWLAGQPPGEDLVPPRYIRNGLRNQSLHREEVKPEHMDNEWFREFVRKYGPPVYLPKP